MLQTAFSFLLHWKEKGWCWISVPAIDSLYWYISALSSVWGVFDTQDISEVGFILPFSGDW